jgi:hypothetical protein
VPAPVPSSVPSFDPGPLPDEFAHIPSRPARPPFLAIGAALLALFLAVRLRDDVAYALSPRTPIDLGNGRAVTTDADLPLNRLVRIAGRPERESAAVLDARGSWHFTQFFRLRGTQGRVFVRRVADPLPVALADRDVFVGRLVAFEDLSFADSIKQHFAARVTATHFFAVEALGKALAEKRLHLSDLSGDDVTLAPEDRLTFDIARPDTFTFEWPTEPPTGLLSGPSADPAAVRAITTAAGGTVIDEVPAATKGAVPQKQRLTVTFPPSARDAIMSRIEGLGRGLQMRPARETVELPVREISVAAGVWRLGAREVPVDRIIAIRTRAPVKIPANAALLIEGEEPRSAIASLVVLAFLSAFAVVNLLSLRRSKIA